MTHHFFSIPHILFPKIVFSSCLRDFRFSSTFLRERIMKIGILVFTILVGSSAWADKMEMNPNTMSYDGQNMEFSYTTGGGCQPHTAEVTVDMVQISKYETEVLVKVYDVTPAPDMCEALVPVNGSVNLADKIKQKAAETGFAGSYFKITFPKAVLSY
jgi:hypothetical protein